MAIATTAEYKTYAGISVTTWDAQFDVIIPAVQKAIERVCGRVFDTATFTEYLDGLGSDVLQLSNPPIASITSIQILTVPGENPTAVDSGNYTFNTGGEEGIVRLEPTSTRRFPYDSFGMPNTAGPQYGIYPCWPKGFRNIKVVYVGGYGSSPASATMPADLKLALYRIVDVVFAQVRQDLTLKSENLGSYSYTRAEDALQYHQFLKQMSQVFQIAPPL